MDMDIGSTTYLNNIIMGVLYLCLDRMCVIITTLRVHSCSQTVSAGLPVGLFKLAAAGQ